MEAMKTEGKTEYGGRKTERAKDCVNRVRLPWPSPELFGAIWSYLELFGVKAKEEGMSERKKTQPAAGDQNQAADPHFHSHAIADLFGKNALHRHD
jgi:hypothetical protein